MKKFIQNLIVLALVTINIGVILHMDANGVQTKHLAIFLADSLILMNMINNKPKTLFIGLLSTVGLSMCPMEKFTFQTLIFISLISVAFTSLAMPKETKIKKATKHKKRVPTLKEVA